MANFVRDDILREVQAEKWLILNEQRGIDLTADEADLDSVDLAWIADQEPLRSAGELGRDDGRDVTEHRVDIVVGAAGDARGLGRHHRDPLQFRWHDKVAWAQAETFARVVGLLSHSGDARLHRAGAERRTAEIIVWRARAEERAAIVDVAVRRQEAIDELGQCIGRGHRQFGRYLFDRLQVVVDDGLTRDAHQIAAFLRDVGGGGIGQRHCRVGSILGHHRQAAERTQTHARLLLEIADGRDGDEFLPLGGPRLVVFEQALVHAGAEQVGEAGGGGIGLGDTPDRRAFRDTDIAEQALAGDAALQRVIAGDAGIRLANAAETTDITQACRVDIQIEHTIKGSLNLLGLGDLRADVRLFVAVTAHQAILRQLRHHRARRLQVLLQLALLEDAVAVARVDAIFDRLRQRTLVQTARQQQAGMFEFDLLDQVRQVGKRFLLCRRSERDGSGRCFSGNGWCTDRNRVVRRWDGHGIVHGCSLLIGE